MSAVKHACKFAQLKTNINDTTFFVLRHLPLSTLSIIATVLAAFLFVVTSVVSASFVLSMFAAGGDLNPPTSMKLIWGVILGALGLVMILSNSIDAVKSIVAFTKENIDWKGSES